MRLTDSCTFVLSSSLLVLLMYPTLTYPWPLTTSLRSYGRGQEPQRWICAPCAPSQIFHICSSIAPRGCPRGEKGVGDQSSIVSSNHVHRFSSISCCRSRAGGLVRGLPTVQGVSSGQLFRSRLMQGAGRILGTDGTKSDSTCLQMATSATLHAQDNDGEWGRDNGGQGGGKKRDERRSPRGGETERNTTLTTDQNYEARKETATSKETGRGPKSESGIATQRSVRRRRTGKIVSGRFYLICMCLPLAPALAPVSFSCSDAHSIP